jgi:hypothetical protein
MSELSCSICFENIVDADAYTTPCNHVFHERCFSEWMRVRSDATVTCPNCRSVVYGTNNVPRDRSSQISLNSILDFLHISYSAQHFGYDPPGPSNVQQSAQNIPQNGNDYLSNIINEMGDALDVQLDMHMNNIVPSTNNEIHSFQNILMSTPINIWGPTSEKKHQIDSIQHPHVRANLIYMMSSFIPLSSSLNIVR